MPIMQRIPDLDPTKLSTRQQEVFEEIAGTRGGVVRGPFAIWLRDAELADKANVLGSHLRLNGQLDRSLFEMAILVIARHWTAQYEWYAHEELARREGLEPNVIEAIRADRVPDSMTDDQRIVYAIASELVVKRDLAEATHDEGVVRLGVDVMIELVTAIGFYTMVAIVLKAFDAPVPGDARPLPVIGN